MSTDRLFPDITPPNETVHAADSPDSPWWRDAVIYQIYPRSWADSNGDGIGDLPGITARLPYLKELGVDAIWLSPFYVSPMHDAGYDVANYRDIDPVFGTLADADALIAAAHGLGLRVIVDLVPNHSSSEHPWFQAALKAGPGSPERARYLFREGKGVDGGEPPNNWGSIFGGCGWSRVTEADGSPGQWYLHIFDSTQPDFDWSNPEVADEFLAVQRFWLDRGVDGFRVDVAHGLVKEAGLPDFAGALHTPLNPLGTYFPMWDQDGVHEIYRTWRALADEFSARDNDVAGSGEDHDRILCAEAWVMELDRLARYVRPDEMHQAFNFDFLETPWSADRLCEIIEASLRNNDAVGAPTTWVLSNHDVIRHATRLALDLTRPRPNGIGADDPQPDEVLGARRARAATTMMLALPGSAYVYQGEELGLPEHTTMPDEFRQDPTFHRTKGTDALQLGRDGCRVPMPWVKDAPSFGFGPGERTWLPQPAAYAEHAVDTQDGVPGSFLTLYRDLLRYRRKHRFGHGSLTWHELCSDEVLAFVNTSGDGERTVLVVTNFGPDPIALPEGSSVLITSGDLTSDRLVPTDTTVWAHAPR